MKFFVITSPEFLSGEAHLITALFENGTDVLHLRKPHSSKDECARLLDAIGKDYERCCGGTRSDLFRHIVLHDHHELCSEYGLQGVHLNSRNPSAPCFCDNRAVGRPLASQAEGRMFTVSASCHSIAEAAERKPSLDYLFLSPVFDSISKAGYNSAYTMQELEDAAVSKIIDSKVIALGGVSASNISTLRRLSFGGAAFLGDIWKRAGDTADFVEHVRLLARLLKEE